MSEHYDFHYQPTGSGAISGQQVLEQTEDAINELGDYVNDNVGGAMDVAQQALETAQTAETNAQTALDTANSFSSAIQSAQQDASTALSTAQTAQTTASNANNTANQASQDANTAVTTANNASGQVSTLSGTVTTLGQRVTTAEGNIGQNTSDITALTTRVGTAEGNITTLQNDVSVAMGNASSAMATAGQVKQQAYVFRYSSTALVASSTNSNTLLDNTDNLKVGDKVIDSSGVLFSITAIDTANSTFTVGSALVDLALDGNVVHTSGNETISGDKVFNNRLIKNIDVVLGTAPSTGKFSNIDIADNNKSSLLQVLGGVYDTGNSYARFFVQNKTADDGSGLSPTGTIRSCGFNINLPASSTSEGQGSITPRANKITDFGLSGYQWRSVWCEKLYLNGTRLDPSAFVTTDTNQTISGGKTFSVTPYIYNSDNTGNTPNITLRSSKSAMGTSDTDNQGIFLNDKNNDTLASLRILNYTLNGSTYLTQTVNTKDTNNQNISASLSFYILNNGRKVFRPDIDNDVLLGYSSNKWKDVNTYLVNGLTPSSLSLPVAPSSTSYIDISSYITVLDSSAPNLFTPPSNGYITFNVTGNLVQIFHDNGLQGKWSVQAGSVNRGFIPVLGGVEVKIYVNASSIDKFWFIPCQGNV